jgi:hypothetical protein
VDARTTGFGEPRAGLRPGADGRGPTARDIAVTSNREEPMRKLFNLTTVASGAAAGMIVIGVFALIGGGYTRSVVHDQLAPQKIFFPAAKELPANLKQYAGQQVDTAKEARAYADDFIGLHLQGIGKGKTYSEVSGAFMKDPNNAQLAQQRQTLFMGETLRGMLLNAWGWGTVGTIATIAGIVLILLGGLLLAVPLLAARAAAREPAGRGTATARATTA